MTNDKANQQKKKSYVDWLINFGHVVNIYCNL